MTTDWFLDLCRARRSIRKYSSEPISPADVAYILECGRLAPSACNMQPWEVVVVDDREIIARLAECTAFGLSKVGEKAGGINFIAGAPLVLAICSRRGMLHKAASLVDMDFSPLDIGIFGEHLVLAAASRGIGTCWIGMASEKRVRPVLALPRPAKLEALIVCGYPEGEKAAPPDPSGGIPMRPRKTLDDFAHHNAWGKKYSR
ncbi:MAG: nitroreductase family protein [Candidatus Brocadiia bacterium]